MLRPWECGGAGGPARRSVLETRMLTGDLELDAAGGNQQLVLHRRAVETAGLPAAELFFGYEEMEYCLRWRRSGIRLLVDGELMRRYGELAGRLGHVRRREAARRYPHSTLWRRYYATRNYVHLMLRTFGRRTSSCGNRPRLSPAASPPGATAFATVPR